MNTNHAPMPDRRAWNRALGADYVVNDFGDLVTVSR